MFIAFLLSSFILAIYSLGVSKAVFGGDSGDIILSYFFAGVPHPPGYPLNTILGWLITRFEFGSTFAFRANYVSAIYEAITIGFLCLVISRLTKSKLIAISSSLFLAFVPLFWLYGHMAEVFQLASLLAVVSVFFLFEWLTSVELKKPNIKMFYFSLLFFGLDVFHHHTVLLLSPAYLYILLKTRRQIFLKKKRVVMGILAFFAGFLPYIFIPFAAFRHTPVNWDSPTNLKNFFQLITRGDYGTFTAARDLIGFTPEARFIQIYWYFKVFIADFTYIGLALIVLGLIYLFLRKRRYFIFLTLAVFMTGPFFLFYASFPLVDVFLQGVSERFLLLSYLFLTIILGFGFLVIRDFAIWFFGKWISFKKELISLTVGLSFLIIPFNLAIINWPKADLSNYQLGDVLARDFLSSADPPGIILLTGDTNAFNAQYTYYVENFNRDSKVFLLARLTRPSYRLEVMKLNEDLKFPESFKSDEIFTLDEFFPEFLELNYDKYPFYAMQSLVLPDGYVLVNEGMLLRIYKKQDKPSVDEQADRIIKNLERNKFTKETGMSQYQQFFGEDILSIYVHAYIENGMSLLRLEKRDEARKLFNLALDFEKNNRRALYGLALSYALDKDCQKSSDLFLKMTQQDEKDWEAWTGLENVYKFCFGDERKASEISEKSKQLQQINNKDLDKL
ncbi:hypothetical protein A2870_03640 [Candidatus Curtissbacteria bacterium RIFCSPHIGHO2_01_FULL_41_11]|uniref:Uncharacterized protein n=1 Tax=Candidatus Curtissbacteria bacterium RIFCSPHIGHO2_01_FULL_41_11 TaxID=1797711 RepID=A0A1F5G5Q6_9BACT|nr:MAG: hypothetical protein A2870_03640 [Candidatus Curtissbacteria bacterium RIFCSPHIGHO2_01_FULL_41_11]